MWLVGWLLLLSSVQALLLLELTVPENQTKKKRVCFRTEFLFFLVAIIFLHPPDGTLGRATIGIGSRTTVLLGSDTDGSLGSDEGLYKKQRLLAILEKQTQIQILSHTLFNSSFNGPESI
jgi:hypothetical protein